MKFPERRDLKMMTGLGLMSLLRSRENPHVLGAPPFPSSQEKGWPEAAYCDGSTVGPNPSPRGGCWAWCHVSGDRMVRHGGGEIIPSQIGLPRITNNLTEMLAALECLEALPDGWDGTLWSDSWVTLCRIRKGSRSPMAGVPKPFLARLQVIHGSLGNFILKLLAGHPSKADLAVGYNSRGVPVSRHNAWCDAECKRLERAGS